MFFGAGNTIQHGSESPVKDLHTGIVTGYAQSKWVSEQLVLEYARLGGHVLVLRPGRLLGNTRDFKCPRDDFTIRLIASILELGVAPDLSEIGGQGWQIDLTPVDFCAALTHQYSLQGETGIRHLFNTDTISYETIVDSLGGCIRRKPYKQWLQLVDQSRHLALLTSLFHESASHGDERSVFEVLLRTEVFRNSSYECTAPKSSNNALPSVNELLQGYLTENYDIFSKPY